MPVLPRKVSCSPLGHSADVRLWLRTANRVIELAQTGDNSVKLAEADRVEAGPAQVEINVDGHASFSDIEVEGHIDDRWLAIRDR